MQQVPALAEFLSTMGLFKAWSALSSQEVVQSQSVQIADGLET